MTRYRYRTPVLTGRWRESREDALRDAVSARQAIADEEAPGGLRWLVPGGVEEADQDGSESGGHPCVRRDRRPDPFGP